jgi:DDE_Tnp_1-associated
MAGDRLELPNGIPSHDTFRRVFLLIDPDAFEACFATWAQSLAVARQRCDGAGLP